MGNEIDALKKFVTERIEILESVSLEGGLSMIAVYVEQAICLYVLPEVFMNNSSDIRAIKVLKMFGVRVNFPNPVSLKYAEEKVDSMKDELPP